MEVFVNDGRHAVTRVNCPGRDNLKIAVFADGDAAPATDTEDNPRDDDPATPNTGAGVPDCADIGAHEFQPGHPWRPSSDGGGGCAPGGGATPLALVLPLVLALFALRRRR